MTSKKTNRPDQPTAKSAKVVHKQSTKIARQIPAQEESPKLSFYKAGTTLDSTGYVIVPKAHRTRIMQQYKINEFGIPLDLLAMKFRDLKSYEDYMHGGQWTQFKHTYGWQHRYCTDKQTKLPVSIHINPIYKAFITGKRANFSRGEPSLGLCYFVSRQELEQYVLYHLGLPNTAINTSRYSSLPPTSS